MKPANVEDFVFYMRDEKLEIVSSTNPQLKPYLILRQGVEASATIVGFNPESHEQFEKYGLVKLAKLEEKVLILLIDVQPKMVKSRISKKKLVSDEIICINNESYPEALVALTAGFPSGSLKDEEIEAGVVSEDGGTEVYN
uniref:Uncharacterized protein n=1 Tax=Solanum lycopersicum TaxID=4081 RepID=A0A3Q7EX89_SOLLC